MLGAEGLARGDGSPHLATAGPRALRLPLLPESLLGGDHQNTKKGFSSQDSPPQKNKNHITRKLNPEVCEKGTPAARATRCREGKVVCFCNIQKTIHVI